MSIVIIAPWTLRNYRVFGAFVPVSTNGGVNLFIGNNEEAKGAYMEPFEITSDNEAKRSKIYSKKAIEYILENPLSFILLIPKKIFYLFYKDNVGIDWTVTEKDIWLLHLLSFALYYPVLVLGTIGLIRKRWLIEHWLFIYFIVFYALFFGADRFHYPLIPILSVYAGRFIFLRISAHR